MLYTILYYYIYPKVFTLTFILPFLPSLSSLSSLLLPIFFLRPSLVVRLLLLLLLLFIYTVYKVYCTLSLSLSPSPPTSYHIKYILFLYILHIRYTSFYYIIPLFFVWLFDCFRVESSRSWFVVRVESGLGLEVFFIYLSSCCYFVFYYS